MYPVSSARRLRLAQAIAMPRCMPSLCRQKEPHEVVNPVVMQYYAPLFFSALLFSNFELLCEHLEVTSHCAQFSSTFTAMVFYRIIYSKEKTKTISYIRPAARE